MTAGRAHLSRLLRGRRVERGEVGAVVVRACADLGVRRGLVALAADNHTLGELVIDRRVGTVRPLLGRRDIARHELANLRFGLGPDAPTVAQLANEMPICERAIAERGRRYLGVRLQEGFDVGKELGHETATYV